MSNFLRKLLTITCLAGALSITGTSVSLHAQEGPEPGGGPGGGRMGFAGGGRPVAGTIAEVTADHLTLKTDNGETYKVFISANTRFMKDRQPVSASDLKVGDVVFTMGKLDENAKTVGAVMVAVLDPERAKQMREMQANYGKTWVAGKITAIQETTITITGRDDKTFQLAVDENTSFRKRRDSITLADVKVGDMVSAKGAAKSGTFAVTELSVMEPRPPRAGGMPPAGEAPKQ